MKTAATILVLMLCFSGVAARAQGFTSQVAPVPPPEINGDLLAPPPPPASEFPALKDDPGLFRWRRPAEISANYLLFSTLSGTLDLKFSDPCQLGSRLGLAEDALEYSAGLGPLIGFDNQGKQLISLLADLGARLYLKEGSWLDADPFLAINLPLNLIGTDGRSAGIGVRLSGGIRKDFGLPGGPLDIAVGYGSYRIGDTRAVESFCLTIGRPLVL
jgi:hypothetical protein